jgi:hypothetical protein
VPEDGLAGRGRMARVVCPARGAQHAGDNARPDSVLPDVAPTVTAPAWKGAFRIKT